MATQAARPEVLFLHIGWAREYRGAATDPPLGKFGFIQAGKDRGGETLNFKDFGGRYYGYAPHQAIDLRRLGASKGAEFIDHVLVVFTATNPDGSGRYVVGWYRDARVYAEMQSARPDRTSPLFITEASAADSHLVRVDDRTFFIRSMAKGWPGVANAFYASENLSEQDIGTLLSYIGGAPSTGFFEPKPTQPNAGGGPRQADPELRAMIEVTAVRAVQAHYEARGCTVESVEDENLGWDLNVTCGARLFHVEVKGRGGVGSVELTPNEYRTMTDKRTRMSYRLAIVHDALTPSPRLTTFQFSPGDDAWLSDQEDRLSLRSMTGAVASF